MNKADINYLLTQQLYMAKLLITFHHYYYHHRSMLNRSHWRFQMSKMASVKLFTGLRKQTSVYVWSCGSPNWQLLLFTHMHTVQHRKCSTEMVYLEKYFYYPKFEPHLNEWEWGGEDGSSWEVKSRLMREWKNQRRKNQNRNSSSSSRRRGEKLWAISAWMTADASSSSNSATPATKTRRKRRRELRHETRGAHTHTLVLHQTCLPACLPAISLDHRRPYFSTWFPPYEGSCCCCSSKAIDHYFSSSSPLAEKSQEEKKRGNSIRKGEGNEKRQKKVIFLKMISQVLLLLWVGTK